MTEFFFYYAGMSIYKCGFNNDMYIYTCTVIPVKSKCIEKK